MLYAKERNGLLQRLNRFFEICCSRRLVISLAMSDLFFSEVSLCERLIGAEGFRFNPMNISGLTQSDNSRTDGKLCEYVHGARWLASSLPSFGECVAPLRLVLEGAYFKMGERRTKKLIARIPVDSLGWNKTHSDAFDGLQKKN